MMKEAKDNVIVSQEHLAEGGEAAATTEKDSALRSNLFDNLPQWKYTFSGFLLGKGEDERLYQEFMSKENSLFTHVVFCLFGFSLLVKLIMDAEIMFGDYSFGFKMYLYQRIIVMPPLLLHTYSIAQKKYQTKLRPLPIDIIYLGDALLLSYAISFGLFLYGMSNPEGCDAESSESSHPYVMCNKVIPMNNFISYIAVSIMLTVVVKCRHMGAVILCIATNCFFLSAVVYIVDPAPFNILVVIKITMVQCCVVFDCDYSRHIYLSLAESRSFVHSKIMTENENIVMEMQSTELRFLIGNVAHDLKTPLQAFSYELESMKSQIAMGGKGQYSIIESILLLESTCSFMLMTINRAIDYTKVTSGIQLKSSLETVDVGGVFEWVKMCVARTVTAGTVAVVIEPFPEGICNCIITDKQWMMENLLCLLSNAQKFTAEGNIYIKYSFVNESSEDTIACDEGKNLQLLDGDSTIQLVSSVSNPSMVMVEVIDDGIGISEEMQQTLFKPFKQAMRRAGGTGLGIYSMSKRVESLGGKCGVSSRADGKSGARFWFTLPYRPDETAAAVVATSTPAKRLSSFSMTPTRSSFMSSGSEDMCNFPGYAVHNNTIKEEECSQEVTTFEDILESGGIMLVEDSALIQKTCARSFLREGIKVDIANNGLECLQKVFKSPNRYTILLMDVNMPLMDGLEATERLRQWERNSNSGCNENCEGDIESNTPCIRESKLLIIGVSANSDSQSRQEALDAGMDRFMTKPMKMSVFKEFLAEFNLDFDAFKNV